MTSRCLIVGFLVLTAIHQAHARLEETEYGLGQRYGQPKEVIVLGQNRKQLNFLKDGWRIEAILYYDNCHYISYRKSSGGSAAAQESLMKANSHGVQWNQVANKDIPLVPLDRGESYARSDGNAYANIDVKLLNKLVFYTKTWASINKPKQAPVEPLPNF